MIELDRPLPLPDGVAVSVSIERPMSSNATGSPAAILEAVEAEPHLAAADVDELERAIDAGRLPIDPKGVFDRSGSR